MSDIKQLHNDAMAAAERAIAARARGDRTAAAELNRQAFELEAAAARLLSPTLAAEPSRSVLLRSAATLALECEDFGEAERLVATALSGRPPEPIAGELRDLLEQVYFRRHLDLRGVSLEADELQLSIAGQSVGFGMALSEEFVSRIGYFEKLVYRTAERRRHRPYREGGSPKRSVQDNYEVFLKAPRAASFAVTLKIGRPKSQLAMAEVVDDLGVVDELMACIGLINDGAEESLQARIPDPAYLRNFVGLARSFAPDGKGVSVVGLTRFVDGHEQHLALTRPQATISTAFAERAWSETPRELVEVVGVLRFADKTHEKSGLIKLIDDEGRSHLVEVPEGLMNDIVKPLWDDRVAVRGYKRRRRIELQDIRSAPTDSAV